jgi:hypothetical protein
MSTAMERSQNGQRLRYMYDSAVAADSETIDMSEPRMYWTDSWDDLRQLHAASRSDEIAVARWASRIPRTTLRFFPVL